MKKKITTLFIITICILLLLPIKANASLEDFTPKISDIPDATKISGITNHLSIIVVLARFVVLGALIVIGIKYVLASAQEKADLKGKLLIYTIGTFVIFAASFIMEAVVSTLNTIN